MEATAQETAQVLEDAADWLLVHGRCRDHLMGPNGEGCVMHALYSGSKYEMLPASRAAEVALRNHLGRGVVGWNFETDDDFEVIDTLRHVAKDLANEAVQ